MLHDILPDLLKIINQVHDEQKAQATWDLCLRTLVIVVASSLAVYLTYWLVKKYLKK